MVTTLTFRTIGTVFLEKLQTQMTRSGLLDSGVTTPPLTLLGTEMRKIKLLRQTLGLLLRNK